MYLIVLGDIMRMKIKISIGLVKLSNNREISTPSTENYFIIGRVERIRWGQGNMNIIRSFNRKSNSF